MLTPPAFLVTGTHYKITYKDNSLLTGVFNGGTDPHGWICMNAVEENAPGAIWVRLDEVRTMTVLPQGRPRAAYGAKVPAKRAAGKAARKPAAPGRAATRRAPGKGAAGRKAAKTTKPPKAANAAKAAAQAK